MRMWLGVKPEQLCRNHLLGEHNEKLKYSYSTIINMEKGKLKKKELEIIKKYEKGLGCVLIAKEYNCDEEAIRQLLIRKNIKRRKPSTYRKYNFNEDFFSKIKSEEQAWLLGFILADGCIKKHNGGHYIKFEISKKDTEILKKINIILNSDYPIIYNEKRKSALLLLSSKKFYYDLYNLGIRERKSFTFTPIKQMEDVFIKHFIRGYFDGDGWITKDKKDNWSFGIIGHKEILELIEKTLQKECNLNKRNNPFIIKSKNASVYQFTIGGNLQVMKIRKFLYDDATVYLRRKKQSFDKVKSTMTESIIERRELDKLRERDKFGRWI